MKRNAIAVVSRSARTIPAAMALRASSKSRLNAHRDCAVIIVRYVPTNLTATKWRSIDDVKLAESKGGWRRRIEFISWWLCSEHLGMSPSNPRLPGSPPLLLEGQPKHFDTNWLILVFYKMFFFSHFQLRERGYICRDSLNECDIPEYCTGDSGLCPKDTFKKNGNVCGHITSPQGNIIGKYPVYFIHIHTFLITQNAGRNGSRPIDQPILPNRLNSWTVRPYY